jgi:hypothetical protein
MRILGHGDRIGQLELGKRSLLSVLPYLLGEGGRAGSNVSSCQAMPTNASFPWLASYHWPGAFLAGEMAQEQG